MNADFEVELGHTVGTYRRLPSFAALNQRLTPHLLWLASPGDALLIEGPPPDALRREAARREVELVQAARAEQTQSSEPPRQGARVFTPWGWTASAAAAGISAGAIVRPIPFETVARVNSKLWSHALEVELGLALKGSAMVRTYEELEEAVARACPLADDKWVIKSPFGFAARERVLGRGPLIELPQGRWAKRRLSEGLSLIFQPWLEVRREYGVVMFIREDGGCEIQGISDLQTNGAGTGKGYILGRRPAPERVKDLESIALIVCERLFKEGYFGPAGVDALEHSEGLHPLLEINARYTMGFVALAVERSLRPSEPIFWSTK